MTRFVSLSMALFCLAALLMLFGFTDCGGPHGNGNVNSAGNGNALTNASPHTGLVVDCTSVSTTNDQIIKAVYDALASYSKEFSQFNVTASKPEVKIVGWSASKTQIVAAAKTAASGCTINDTSFADSKPTLGANYQQRIGCPPNYGPCGDICIPVGDPCKVTAGPAAAPAWTCVAAPTPTP